MNGASAISGGRDTCAFCRRAWGECACFQDGANIAFEHNGDLIERPNVSSCGRFFVEPVIVYDQAWLDFLTPTGRQFGAATACGICGFIDAQHTCCPTKLPTWLIDALSTVPAAEREALAQRIIDAIPAREIATRISESAAHVLATRSPAAPDSDPAREIGNNAAQMVILSLSGLL